MERPYLTLKQMAEVLKIPENELLELVKKKQIPFEVTDEGTVYQAYRFIEEDVLTAFKPSETEEEQPEAEEKTEPVKEPEPEQPIEGQGEGPPKPEEVVEKEPQPEQPSEQTEDAKTDPFEEAKEEEPKE